MCVCVQQNDEAPKLKEVLAAPLRMLQEAARRIARVSVESKLTVDEEEYVAKFRSELMDVVFQWAKVRIQVKMTSKLKSLGRAVRADPSPCVCSSIT